MKKRYSVLQNYWYIIKRISNTLIVFMIINAIAVTAITYIGPLIVREIIDAVTIKMVPMEEMIGIIIKLSILYLVTNGVCEYVSLQVWYRTIESRHRFIPLRMQKFLSMNYEHLEKPETLDLARRAYNAVEINSKGIEAMLRNSQFLFIHLLKLGVAIGLVSYLSPLVAIVLFLFGWFGIFLTHKARERTKLEEDGMASWERKQVYWEEVASSPQYAKDIRLFQAKDFFLHRLKEVRKEANLGRFKISYIWMRFASVIHVINLVQEVLSYAMLIYFVIQGSLSVGDFTLYLVVINTFSSSIGAALDFLSKLKTDSEHVNDFREFLELDEKENEKVTEEIPEADRYEIELENVSFSYTEEHNFVLKNINLKIAAGEKLALVGLNGSGKSTLIKLLCGLYEPTEGRILLNGVDRSLYKKADYYQLFAAMFQEVQIFALSMLENVSMSPSRETDQDRVLTSIKVAGLEDKVEGLKDGIHTPLLKVLDEDGTELSGGESQKLSFARAFYKDANCLIFDEPTAALDSLSEQKYYRSFQENLKEKSIVFISHRLSSTQFCDRIILLQQGCIIEDGNHRNLMEMDGEYARLYLMQSKRYQEVEGE